ncbi:MAG: ketopantoate reductase C-terminal domain-containing protein [Micropepsaceae bacterium]
MGSIVVDRLNGRATEWVARNEVVLRLAAKHGIAVPLNEVVCNLIRAGEPN